MTWFLNEAGAQFASAFVTTLLLAGVSLLLTAAASTPLALALHGRSMWVRAYVDLSMKIPLIVKLFICFYLLRLNPSACGVIALVLHQAGYCAEILKGGLAAVPSEYEDAAISTGLQPWRIALSIRVPEALRLVAPSLVLQTAEIVKNTSIVSLIGIVELTGAAETLQSQTFEYLSGFCAATACYAVLTLPLMAAGHWMEHRLRRYA
ncbi:ABC transporter permease subunit [Pigmentiphaga aceris]|uniref:ABC transporter permease subunit n=1 Tax=Pigmentiphaga aceris TaxID=1940612 RepID=A0A5C0AV80_9BURK|nr:ABC transporter permease subunit [Pigmentiphaga aceris]QEI06095.1 ABC transporter permease subunit [Pigmentiphaga aceris]